MLIGLVLLAFILVATVVYWLIPYSPLKAKFNRDMKTCIQRSSQAKGILTDRDVQVLPAPVQHYLKTCGYMGRSKSSYMRIDFEKANFKLSLEKPMIHIGYSQMNFVQKPGRAAFIVATSMNGTRQQVRWSALFSDYQTRDGMKQPSRLQAIWHVPEGDILYFDSSNFHIRRF